MAVTSGCGQRPGAQSSCPGTGGQLAPLRATRICRGLDARDHQPVHEGETEAGRRGPGRKGARPQGTAGSALSTRGQHPLPASPLPATAWAPARRPSTARGQRAQEGRSPDHGFAAGASSHAWPPPPENQAISLVLHVHLSFPSLRA